MPDTSPIVDAYVDATLDAIDFDAVVRDQLLERRLLAEHHRRLTPAKARAPRADRRTTRRWTGLGAAVAGAAAVILVIALGPGDQATNRSHLPSPDSAEAALQAAGESAADVEWAPLGPHDYFHLSTSTFTPDLPEVDGDDPNGRGSMFLGGVHANETWFARDGSGQTISVNSSGDPSRFPSVHRDPETGEVRGIGSRQVPPGTEVDVAAALRQPDTVNVMAWPRGDRLPFQRTWVRTRDGYFKTNDFVMNERTMGRAQTPENTMRQFLAVPMKDIDAANEMSDPDRAARKLIDEHASDPNAGFRPTKSGITVIGGVRERPIKVSEKQLRDETAIEHAVQLLGTAPLSPPVRRALFRWLASQPGAEVRHDAVDAIGRRGTEVTFETLQVNPVPRYKVTAAELIDANRGIRGIERLDRDKVYTVTGNENRRRWRVSFIVDTERGELLQQLVYFRQGRTGAYPFVVTYKDGPRIDVRDPGGGSGGGVAQLFLSRDFAQRIEPSMSVCRTNPRVCQ